MIWLEKKNILITGSKDKRMKVLGFGVIIIFYSFGKCQRNGEMLRWKLRKKNKLLDYRRLKKFRNFKNSKKSKKLILMRMI